MYTEQLSSIFTKGKYLKHIGANFIRFSLSKTFSILFFDDIPVVRFKKMSCSPAPAPYSRVSNPSPTVCGSDPELIIEWQHAGESRFAERSFVLAIQIRDFVLFDVEDHFAVVSLRVP